MEVRHLTGNERLDAARGIGMEKASSYGERGARRRGPLVKHLYLLRHAKARAGEDGQGDHARRLTGRGRRAADEIGEFLAEHGETPDLALCSSSERTRETLERVLDHLPEKPRVVVETELYLAGCESLLARLRALPDEIDRVLLVGHHPGVADLAELLATDGPHELRKRLAEKFPTAALAILGIPHGRWCDAGPGARLEAFVLPRELEKA